MTFRRILQIFTLTLVTTFVLPSLANNRRIMHQGRVLNPSGSPLQGNYQVEAKIFSPSPSRCLLWGEAKAVTFVNGAFNYEIGDQARRMNGASAGSSTSFPFVFMNETSNAVTGGNCDAGTTYTPQSNDRRVLVITLYDGPLSIKVYEGDVVSVPYAIEAYNAQMVGGYAADHILKYNESGSHKPTLTLSTLGASILWEVAENRNFGNRIVTGVASPSGPTDAVNLQYLNDSIASALGGGGTAGALVRSVDAVSQQPTTLEVTGGPITNTGTLSFSFLSQAANFVFAAPTGAAGTPLFRALDPSDIPALHTSKITTGTLGVSRGGTGLSNLTPYAILASNMTGDAIEQHTCSLGEVLVWSAGGGWVCETKTSGAGTVTHVGFEASNIFDVTGSPLTTAGTIGLNLASQLQGLVLASPTGTSGVPSFRALAGIDLPVTAGTGIDLSLSNGSLVVSAIAGTTGLSQWSNNANGIHYNTGSVGIGVAAPLALLDVRQNVAQDMNIRFQNNFNGNGLYQTLIADSQWIATSFVSPTQGWNMGMHGSGDFVIKSDTAGTVTDSLTIAQGAPTNALYIANDGKIGLGVTGPFYSISLKGETPGVIGVEPNTNNAAGQSLMLLAGAANLTQADLNGGDLLLASGTATGIGGSAIQFQTSQNGAAGTTRRDPTTRMTLTSEGRLGLGTMNPTVALDVEASGNMGSAIRIPRADTASRPASAGVGMMRYNTDLNRYEVYESAGWATLSTSSGSINTGNSWVQGGNIFGQTGTIGTNDLNSLRIVTDGTVRTQIGTDGQLRHYGDIDVSGSDVSRTLTVGNNDSVSGKTPNIEVYNHMGATGEGFPEFKLVNRRGTSSSPAAIEEDDILGQLRFAGSDSAGYTLNSGASIYAIAAENYTTTIGGTDLVFETIAIGTASPLEKLRITANGNIGIGKPSPTVALDIGSNGTMGSAIRIPQDTTARRPATGGVGMMRFNTDLNVYEVYESGGSWASLSTSSGSAGASQWQNNSLGINYSAGSVGIGTAAPVGALTVIGNGARALAVGTSATNPTFSVDTSVSGGVAINGNAIVATNPNSYLYLAGSGDGVYLAPCNGCNSQLNVRSNQVEIGSNSNESDASKAKFLFGPNFPDSNLTAGAEATNVRFDIGTVRTHANGAIATQRDFRITGSPHAFTSGSSTITNAAVFSVDGPNPAGTNAVITNSSAIYVPASNLASSGTVTNSYGLNVNAATGATNNYAATFMGGGVGIGTMAASVALDVNVTGQSSAIRIPRDSTGNRPTASDVGMMRYNTDDNKYEVYETTGWASLSTSSGTAGASQWSNVALGINYASGSVGVGVASPNARLSVGGRISIGAGTTATPGLFFGSDTDTGISSAGENLLEVSVGANRKLLFGTTDTYFENNNVYMFNDYAYSYAPTGVGYKPNMTGLTTGNKSWFNGGSNGLNIEVMNSGGTTQRMYVGAHSVASGYSPNFVVGVQNAASAYTERMRIDSTGQMGVGTFTPTAMLDIGSNGSLGSAIRIPQDTSARRPTNSYVGMMRYNTDDNKYEVYETTGWASLSTSSGTAGLSQWQNGTLGIYYSSGSVGIGTASPGFNLEVNGTSYTTTAIAHEFVGSWDGTALNPIFSRRNDTNTGMYFAGADTLAFSTAGTNAVTIMPDGRVSVGSTAQAARFAIKQSGTGSTDGLLLEESSGSGTGRAYLDSSGNFHVQKGTNGGETVFGADSVALRALGTTHVYLKTGGLLGIGTTTPTAALDVALTGTLGSAIRIPRDSEVNRPRGSAPADLVGMMRYNTTANKYEVYENNGWASLSTSSGTAAASQWTNTANGIYLAAGSVGINGTPDMALDVVDPTHRGLTDTLGNVGIHTSSAFGQNKGAVLSMGGMRDGSDFATFATISARKQTATSGDQTGYLSVHVNNSGTMVERMRVAADGRVGLGTNSPTTNLYVQASGTPGGFNPASGDILALDNSGASGNAAHAYLISGDSSGGAYYIGGGSVPKAGGIGYGSIDKKLNLRANNTEVLTIEGENRVAGLFTTTPTAALDVVGLGTVASAIRIPRDTEAMRPTRGTAAELQGMMRYNTTSNKYEVYEGTTGWLSIPTATSASGLSLNDLSDARVVNTTNYFIGLSAGDNATSGFANTVYGHEAGVQLTSGYGNSFIGSQAGNLTTTKFGNTVVGASAYSQAPGGDFNSILGVDAGKRLDSNFNILIGSYTGENIGTGGGENVVIGTDSAQGSIGTNTAERNVMVGLRIASDITTGAGNVVVGHHAGYDISSAFNNIILGRSAGQSLTTGDRNIIIGDNVDVPSPTASQKLNIGNLLYGDMSTGYVGIGQNTPTSELHLSAGIGAPGEANKIKLYDDGTYSYGFGISAYTLSYVGTDHAFYSPAEAPTEQTTINQYGISTRGHYRFRNAAGTDIGELAINEGSGVDELVFNPSHAEGAIALNQGTRPVFRVAGPGHSSVLELYTKDSLLNAKVPGVALYSDTSSDFLHGINVQGSMGVNLGGSPPSAALHVSGDVLATAYLYSSDRSLKKDIRIVEGLSKILQLNGKRFNWISNDRADIGLIAQEVEEVFPELVHTAKNGKKSVQYGNLVAPLIEATKELYGLCHASEEQLSSLDAKIQAQGRRLASVEEAQGNLQQENSALKNEVELLKQKNQKLEADLEKIKKHLGLE